MAKTSPAKKGRTPLYLYLAPTALIVAVTWTAVEFGTQPSPSSRTGGDSSTTQSAKARGKRPEQLTAKGGTVTAHFKTKNGPMTVEMQVLALEEMNDFSVTVTTSKESGTPLLGITPSRTRTYKGKVPNNEGTEIVFNFDYPPAGARKTKLNVTIALDDEAFEFNPTLTKQKDGTLDLSRGAKEATQMFAGPRITDAGPVLPAEPGLLL